MLVRLVFLLENLIKKAAKYTGKGTNEVQQKTSVTRKATNYPSVLAQILLYVQVASQYVVGGLRTYWLKKFNAQRVFFFDSRYCQDHI